MSNDVTTLDIKTLRHNNEKHIKPTFQSRNFIQRGS